MTKQAGMGNAFYVDGVDISGDIGSLSSIACPGSPLELTGIDKFAYERQMGKRDGTMSFAAWFNAAAGQEHPTLSPLPTTDRLMSWVLANQLLGSDVATLNCKQINYDPTRDADGGLTIAVEGQANGWGLEWGNLLTAGKRTDTTATSPATGLDLTTVSTAFGWQAYVHVFAFAGTSVTFTLADSADNSAFTNLTGGAFTAISSAPATQRLASAAGATVRRFVRVSTSGTFSNCVFALAFTRNQAAVTF